MDGMTRYWSYPTGNFPIKRHSSFHGEIHWTRCQFFFKSPPPPIQIALVGYFLRPLIMKFNYLLVTQYSSREKNENSGSGETNGTLWATLLLDHASFVLPFRSDCPPSKRETGRKWHNDASATHGLFYLKNNRKTIRLWRPKVRELWKPYKVGIKRAKNNQLREKQKQK